MVSLDNGERGTKDDAVALVHASGVPTSLPGLADRPQRDDKEDTDLQMDKANKTDVKDNQVRSVTASGEPQSSGEPQTTVSEPQTTSGELLTTSSEPLPTSAEPATSSELLATSSEPQLPSGEPVPTEVRQSSRATSKPTKQASEVSEKQVVRSRSTARRQHGFKAPAVGDHRSMLDYMAVAVTVAELPVVMAMDLLTNAVASSNKRRPFRDTALDSIMGHCYRSSTLVQLRIMTGVRSLKQELSSMLYRCDGTRRKLKQYNVEFRPEAPGFSARWIHEVPNRTPQDPVLLYFHGGGYALKTCQPQVQYICELARAFRKQRLSVLVLDYTITPFKTYPVQRNQALACMAALKAECENIVLFGDSCGGNLALSILQEVDGPYAMDPSRLLGCVLVSPWTDPGAQTGSMNSKRDILSKRRLNEMAASYVTKDQLADPHVTPLRAKPDVWRKTLPARTCCVWGEIECLADQCEEFVRLAGIENCFVEKNGTHDCILRGLTPPPSCYISKQLATWIGELAAKHKQGAMYLPGEAPHLSDSQSDSTSESLPLPGLTPGSSGLTPESSDLPSSSGLVGNSGRTRGAKHDFSVSSSPLVAT